MDVVLDVGLTVEDMVRWFPLPIEPVDPQVKARLQAGDEVLAESIFAGRRLETKIEVLQADATRYRLTATGPVCFDVSAELTTTPDGCEIEATVEARSGGGLTGRVLEGACRPLLGTGLRQALDRIALLAESRPVPVQSGH